MSTNLHRFYIALRISLIAFGAVWAISAIYRDSLPGAEEILPEIRTQPVQVPTSAPQFEVERGGVTYAVTPLYDYKLYGLVVSTHDSRSWLDYAHESWDDYLNVMDICVVWGSNVRDELYNAFEFASGQWTCRYKTDDHAAWQAWYEFQLSNNHILSGSEEVTQAVTQAEVGDQIFLQGYLSEYSHGGGFHRGTSTTRSDRGDGACETVYVTDFKILRQANVPVRILHRIGRYGFLLSLLGLAAVFVKTTFFPGQPDPWELLAQGRNLAMRGKHGKALALLTQAIDLEPEVAEMYEDRALVLEALGEAEIAKQDRREAARLRGETSGDPSGLPPFLDI
ncbi:MAG: hypothetical protein D6E12_17450 [Desulfovibrio sp.]|nr:MAG: hypothetical protein D6E12_17450 [Desulfovibrio sp.]